MCDFENSCIYYQDYAKRVRKNKMALARKYIKKLKMEVDKCKYMGLKNLSKEFKDNIKKQLTDALKIKEEEYVQKFGKKLKFKKAQYPPLSMRECDCCSYRIDYTAREHKKAKRNLKFDEIVIVEDDYRNIPIRLLPLFNKEKALKATAEYHEKLLREKYKK